MSRLITLMLMVLMLAAALPTHAQDGGTRTVVFDGVGFTFDTAVGTQVHIQQVPGDPLDRVGPSGPQPPYTEFLVLRAGVETAIFFSAPLSVVVYRTADMLPYARYLSIADEVTVLLAERPDLSVYMQSGNGDGPALPFLPTFSSRQILRSQVHYLDDPAITGIAYVAKYCQGPCAFLNNSFVYMFQGFSADGAYYISIRAQLYTDLFPQETPADYLDTFQDEQQAYRAASQETLNAATPGDFAPSLDALDAVAASFTFGS